MREMGRQLPEEVRSAFSVVIDGGEAYNQLKAVQCASCI